MGVPLADGRVVAAIVAAIEEVPLDRRAGDEHQMEGIPGADGGGDQRAVVADDGVGRCRHRGAGENQGGGQGGRQAGLHAVGVSHNTGLLFRMPKGLGLAP